MNRPIWCRDGDCNIPDKISLGCFKCGIRFLKETGDTCYLNEPVVNKKCLYCKETNEII